MSDPYLNAAFRQFRNRLRGEPVAVVRDALLPLVAAVALVPLLRPPLLGVLTSGEARFDDTMGRVALWTSLVVVGWLALDAFSAVVRSEDRVVVDILPVDGAAVVRAEVLRLLLGKWWLVPAFAVITSPLVTAGHGGAFMGLVLLVSGSLLLGASAGAVSHLIAVRVAESPAAAPFLDLIRGHNPRSQAAFLYAPGVLVIAVGGLLSIAAGAVPRVDRGEVLAIGLVLLPAVAAVPAWWGVQRLAPLTYARGGAVMTEIDHRYKMLEDAGEESRVYLDWVVRWLPARLHAFVLDDLRHGWRTRRSLVTLAWLFGLAGLGAGWTSHADGPLRATIVAVGGVLVVAGNGVWLSRDEPLFLRRWLPRGGAGLVARFLVLVLWAMPVAVLPMVAVVVRQGFWEGLLVFATGAVAAGLGAGLSVLAGVLRERGFVLYGPVAAVVGTVLVLVVGGAR